VSTPDQVTSTPVDPAEIDAAVADLDRRLRRLHLPRADRRAIGDDVRGDLRAAADDGIRPADLIGPDVDAFAREAVEQGGYRPWRPEYLRAVLGGVLGALVCLFVGYWLVVGAQQLLAATFTLDRHYPVAGPAVVVAGVAVLALLGALVVLGRVLAGRQAARATVRRAALLLPSAVVVGAGAAAAGALVPDEPWPVAVLVLCIAVPFVAALWLSRAWALHSER
jgi:hypothetical protein